MKKIFNFWFGTKDDARITCFFLGLGLVCGGIAWLLGTPWWLSAIIVLASPALLYFLAIVLFVLLLNAILG